MVKRTKMEYETREPQGWRTENWSVKKYKRTALCSEIRILSKSEETDMYLMKLSTAEIIQHPWQMTSVRIRIMGRITPTGEKRKYLDKTLSQCRTEHKKSHRDWNELTVFAVQRGRGK